MAPSPALGAVLHALGGIGAASFYIPLTRVRSWAWESFWLAQCLAFQVVCPWVIAWFTAPHWLEILRDASWTHILTAMGLGFFWGIGSLSFGLSIRYLGMSLTFSLAMGLCIVFGALGPLALKSVAPDLLDNFRTQKPLASLWTTSSGLMTLAGLVVSVVGIACCGWAGARKEHELDQAAKQETVREFNFFKGVSIAIVSGVLSAAVNFAITDTEPIQEHTARLNEAAAAPGPAETGLEAAATATDAIWLDRFVPRATWNNSVTMALFLTGGFLSTCLWCLALNVSNRTLGDYVSAQAPLARNYALCALSGAIAYSEFFFFGVAAPHMGAGFSFLNLPIHLALVIIMGNLWAIVFREWKGTSGGTRLLITAGILILIASTVLMGWGIYLDAPLPAMAAVTP